MAELATQVETSSAVIVIGGFALRINTDDPDFLAVLHRRYAGFISDDRDAEFELDLDVSRTRQDATQPDVAVRYDSNRWLMQRGDFDAEWSNEMGRGRVRQTATDYSTDSVLRIVHTLILAKTGGFLMHAASAIRKGKAFLFAGVSGAGKTTLSRLAPPDATLLTDEISYVRKIDERYIAFGTPFTGELAKLGENTSAPIAALYLLAKGTENRIDPVSVCDAGREVLANMLFFAADPEMVNLVFQSACDFVDRVPVFRLTFVPDARVWELIG